MGIIAAHHTVGTVAVKVIESYRSPQRISVHNAEHASNVDMFVGGPGVTVSNGLHIHSDETLQFDLPAGDELWVIADTDDSNLHTLTFRM